MLEVADTKELEFLEHVKSEVDWANKFGGLTDWKIYEALKNQIKNYGIEYETGIKIITEALGL